MLRPGMARPPRFVVGIDLGTTHTVVGIAATAAPGPDRAISAFPIAQQVSPGELAEKPLLASARYHAAPGEVSEAARALAEHDIGDEAFEGTAIVGAGALRLGEKSPTRLVTSAKSWLSH